MSRAVGRVAILGHSGRPSVRRAAARLLARLARRRIEVRVDADLGHDMNVAGHPLATLGRWCQLLVALGGDGTALRGARALAGHTGALLAVNFGGMGFLTAAEEPELDSAVDAALAGRWSAPRRRLVGATLLRRERVVHRGVALNDAVIKTAGGYSALHLRLAALGSDLGHLVADGIIAASASGSTAYSLSAGGPVLSQTIEALVVTPVCPHTLGSRSLVLSARDTLELRLLGALDRVLLLLDGQDAVELEAGDDVRIALARTSVRVLDNPARPLARALQGKLGWQGSERRSLR
jgi:NAD+ kinase